MTLVGGMGTLYGPVVGALVVVSMQNYLAQYGQWVTVIQGGRVRGLRARIPARHRRRTGGAGEGVALEAAAVEPRGGPCHGNGSASRFAG